MLLVCRDALTYIPAVVLESQITHPSKPSFPDSISSASDVAKLYKYKHTGSVNLLTLWQDGIFKKL